MKPLRIIAIIVLVLVALFFIVALFLPSKVHVERSMVMNCKSYKIFDEVNNLQNWTAWSPFEDEDTSMKIIYEGPDSGVDAIMKWTSKMNGSGKLTIVESIPTTYIKAALDFMKSGTAQSEWNFIESDTGTIVTWILDIGNLPYPMGRYFGLAMPKMMNKTYDLGLTNLKNLCENLPEIEGIAINRINAQPVLYIRDSAEVNRIGLKMTEMYGELMKYMSDKKIEMAGPPYAAYYTWDPLKPYVFEAGIPVKTPVAGSGRIEAGEIASGKVLSAPFYGSYDKLGDIHIAIQKYLELKKMGYTGVPWEVYVTDPSTEPDTTKWLTLINYRLE